MCSRPIGFEGANGLNGATGLNGFKSPWSGAPGGLKGSRGSWGSRAHGLNGLRLRGSRCSGGGSKIQEGSWGSWGSRAEGAVGVRTPYEVLSHCPSHHLAPQSAHDRRVPANIYGIRTKPALVPHPAPTHNYWWVNMWQPTCLMFVGLAPLPH